MSSLLSFRTAFEFVLKSNSADVNLQATLIFSVLTFFSSNCSVKTQTGIIQIPAQVNKPRSTTRVAQDPSATYRPVMPPAEKFALANKLANQLMSYSKTYIKSAEVLDTDPTKRRRLLQHQAQNGSSIRLGPTDSKTAGSVLGALNEELKKVPVTFEE